MTHASPRNWIALALGLTVGGCAGHFQPPVLDTPARYAHALSGETQGVVSADWWRALGDPGLDAAVALGRVATSPVRGHEPVQALAEIQAPVGQANGLAAGQVKPLGARWPRRWIGEP